MTQLPQPYTRYRYSIKSGKITIFGIRVKILKPAKDSNGRKYYSLYDNSKKYKTLYEGHIAYGIKVGHFEWLPDISRGNLQIDHKDRNFRNNDPKNVRLATRNKQARNRDIAVITPTHIKKILKLEKKGYSHRKIAKELNLRPGTVYDILSRGTHHDITKRTQNRRNR